MTILETHDLKKYYGAGDTQVKALDGVDLSIEQGEFVAIVGTSGSGKSTLLHMLGGLDRPTSGTVTVDGRDIFALKDEALTIFRRRKIGFVFQSYNLVPVLSVWENIVLPVELDGAKVDEGYVREVIATLGLEKKLTNLPNQLSGGQQQRVAIARALATKPAILLADEPTGNLDILMGAYIYGDYPDEKTLTIYGSLNQSVEDHIDYTENIVEIQGGNHAQFGNYGPQKGDLPAEISAQEQQSQTVAAIQDFLWGK